MTKGFAYKQKVYYLLKVNLNLKRKRKTMEIACATSFDERFDPANALE